MQVIVHGYNNINQIYVLGVLFKLTYIRLIVTDGV